MSNIDSLIILLTVIYYILNPCILSFPLVAFIFCYYTIATNKQVHLMTIYIFLLILTTELMMLVQPDSTVLGQGNTVKFLFDTDPDTGEVYYNQGYLYFFFVMIFLSQEVVRYKGNRYRTELEA
jgi:glucan phosphoethanolaminetransferase (alkaline phosphatase superfamily)